MNLRQFFTTAIFSLFFVIFLCSSGNGQSKTDSYLTWPELKQAQQQDKVLLENRQREELRDLKEIHKAALDKASMSDTLLLTDKFKEERKEISRIHAEERSKLAQTHADERKAFLQNKNQNQP